MNEHNYRWFAARLMLAVYDINAQNRKQMSVEVKGLADTVRQAKAAIAKASDKAARLNESANRLTGTLGQVDDLTTQLDTAHAELQAAVGQLSNGGPPLGSGEASEAASIPTKATF